MSRTRQDLRHYSEILAIRQLQQRAAEQDAHAQRDVTDEAQAVLTERRADCADCIDAWSRSAAIGADFDPVMASLWAAELSACERREALAATELTQAEAELEEARLAWRRAMAIAEQADTQRNTASRRHERVIDERRLHETADSSALRTHAG